ncbi:MAG TPA: rhomboid family intramembrane serine protease [Thermoanaerobaculia bacterium]
MLIPIGRDDAEIRRHAWVSYAIIALNIFVYVVMSSLESNSTRAFQQRFSEAVQYQIEHPYLKTPPKLEKLLTPRGNAQLNEMRNDYGRVSPSDVASEQLHLDQLADEALSALDAQPKSKLSYIPARGGVLTMFTSMFLHADFFHLLGNLLFFYLSGPFIEDVFGRPLFAFLYFAGGLVALFAYLSQHPDDITRLMGASGAIAAVMGAYLVRFATSKIEFIFMPFWWRPSWSFRFWMPAFIVLPLWFLQQLWEMRLEVSGDGGGVAFSAHVGGFVFGVVVALIVKFSRFEDKFVNPVVVAQTTWAMDERLLTAMDARKFGNLEGAQHALDGMMRDPDCPPEALQVAMDVAVEAEDPVRYDAAATRLLARHVDAKDADLAMDLIREVTGNRDARVPKFLARAAPIVERSGDREWAITLYERLHDSDPASAIAVSSLMKIATLRKLQGDINGARAALTKARAHPACTVEWAPSIDAKLAQLK